MEFANLAVDADVESNGDVLGGGQAMDSDLYMMKLKYAYITIATSGSICLNVVMMNKNKKPLTQQFYMTSGTAKGGKNYYVDKSGTKKLLPGFETANDLAILTTGQPIGKLKTTEKIIPVYNFEERKEVPTKVKMYMDLVGKPVGAGIVKITENKKKKDPATAKYVAIAETRTINEVSKFFRASDGRTCEETKVKDLDPEKLFIKRWKEKYQGVTLDRTEKVTAAQEGSPSDMLNVSETEVSTESLFLD